MNRTSRNSSSPPSSDPPSAEKRFEKKKTGKKRGGQTGHQGHTRFLYEPTDCEDVFNHRPETCSCCGEKLSGENTNAYCHQIVEIPPIKPIIVEHRLHQLDGYNLYSRSLIFLYNLDASVLKPNFLSKKYL
ncbi:MAG: DUF6444 domain-containing protein [Rhizonema sp. PD37]|nr:DUF6444 domain-containing protein [Rhizonema sp. PD37]